MKRAVLIGACILMFGVGMLLVGARIPTMDLGQTIRTVQTATASAEPSQPEPSTSPTTSMQSPPLSSNGQASPPRNCFPTPENPRYSCIPRDRNGSVGQLGGILPNEYPNLPAQK